MGTEISQEDLMSINDLATQVCSIGTYCNRQILDAECPVLMCTNYPSCAHIGDRALGVPWAAL